MENKSVGDEDMKALRPHIFLGGCKTMQPLWETLWLFLKKLNIEFPYDSAIPLLKNTQNNRRKRLNQILAYEGS